MTNSNANSIQIDGARAQNFIAARAIVKTTQVGETVRFHVQGNGNTIAVTKKDGSQVFDNATGQIPLFKTIYNVKANSQLAMMNTRNQGILREAMNAESDGNVELAHTKFNEYLNKIQVSFSVILNPGRQNVEFYNGQLVEGEIELVTTENGQLITIANPRAVKVAKLDATPAFSLADLMGVDETKPETVFTPTEGATAGAEAQS